MKLRKVWLSLHRYVGLLIALFLVIEGITGSIKAFDHEINRLISPQLYAQPQPDVPQLDLVTLAERAGSAVPQGSRIGLVMVDNERAEVMVVPDAQAMSAMQSRKVDPQAVMNSMFTLYLDPWTGAVLGRRAIGAGNGSWSDGWVGFMAFVTALHDRLALDVFGLIPRVIGQWLLGVVALAWTIDCFVSYYLTFPARRRGPSASLAGEQAARPRKSWWARWKPAWLVKLKGSFYRVNFDLHRANGLWLWPLLLVFAWSSVMLNLGVVYNPVTKALFGLERESQVSKARMAQFRTTDTTTPDLREVLATGRLAIEAQGRRQGFTVGKICGLMMAQPNTTAHLLYVQTSRDAPDSDYGCGTMLTFDRKSGQVIALQSPGMGQDGEPTGNFISRWLKKLHYAHPIGLWYQIIVAVTGLVIALLSVTGVYLWWKKRRAHQWSKGRSERTMPAAALADGLAGPATSDVSDSRQTGR